MSDQNLTQILPLDPKISAKKMMRLRKLEKVKVQKKNENENAIFANIDFRAK